MPVFHTVDKPPRRFELRSRPENALACKAADWWIGDNGGIWRKPLKRVNALKARAQCLQETRRNGK
jgi:hypothetical protein